jgi:hypothetical protein
MKRADLRQAIAILKAVGMPELRVSPPHEPPPPRAEPDLLAHVTELESLLREPLVEPRVRKAKAIAVGIARHARYGRVANLSMQLVSAVHEAAHEAGAGPQKVGVALARLRAAVEEAERPES